MKITKIGNICTGQDGAAWGPFLFRFKSDASCCVYVPDRLAQNEEGTQPCAQFRLDSAELLMPHSNAVSFGCEYAEEGDEFPLLYTNVYNSYAKETNRREGTCCVYRLWREGTAFHTELRQVIQIGFTGDRTLWRSAQGEDVRPYGNFVIDRACGLYYGFTMRDEEQKTRYFAFSLPKLCDGQWDERIGARVVTLTPDNILYWFDCPYQHYLQGACVHGGRIYSLEGFTDDPKNPPMLRVVDLQRREQIASVALQEWGLTVEPELIAFCGDSAVYADHDGSVYQIDFS